MEDLVRCCLCKGNFDPTQAVPMVLKCGDTACMVCLLKLSNLGRAKCSLCNYTFLLDFSGMKDLPVNKALLNILKNKITYFNSATNEEIHPFIEEPELCKRPGCKNLKYEHQNTVYEYCSIRCMEEDKTDLIAGK